MLLDEARALLDHADRVHVRVSAAADVTTITVGILGNGNLAVAVKDGSGRILGVFAMAPSSYTPDEAYLLSDFAVVPTDYPRLSKLVVLAATSSEAQLMCQRTFSRRIRAVSTTAFSNNPVSMKYRGLLRLTKRGPSNEDGWKFQLQYQGAMGEHSLAQALEKWAKRWGARTTQTEVRSWRRRHRLPRRRWCRATRAR